MSLASTPCVRRSPLGPAGLTLAGCSTAPVSGDPGGAVRVVAAENFWGSLAAQLGGEHVRAARHEVGYLPQRRSFEASVPLRGVDVVRLGVDGDRWGLPLPGRRSRAAAARVGAMVGRIARTEEVAVIMVAHDVNPILSHLDRVLYLGGRTAVSGTPAEVITSAALSALYRTPTEVLSTSDGRLVVVGQPEAAAHHGDRHP